jgi:hypothetical protein
MPTRRNRRRQRAQRAKSKWWSAVLVMGTRTVTGSNVRAQRAVRGKDGSISNALAWLKLLSLISFVSLARSNCTFLLHMNLLGASFLLLFQCSITEFNLMAIPSAYMEKERNKFDHEITNRKKNQNLSISKNVITPLENTDVTFILGCAFFEM